MSNIEDFNFMHGQWTVKHRKLRTRLSDANDWYEFSGRSSTQAIMHGLGNLEDNFLDDPGGAYHACALRNFENKTGLWRIWWLDMRYPDNIGPPVEGRFEENIGTFLTKDMWKDKEVTLRFIWRKNAGHGPRWEQAMSLDQGNTWETNWVMDFRPA